MPKFMTYQRPSPVNKANWGHRTGANPYLPVRRTRSTSKPAEIRLDIQGLPDAPKSR